LHLAFSCRSPASLCFGSGCSFLLTAFLRGKSHLAGTRGQHCCSAAHQGFLVQGCSYWLLHHWISGRPAVICPHVYIVITCKWECSALLLLLLRSH